MSQMDSTREHVMQKYHDRARHDDLTGNLYSRLGFRVGADRRLAIQALGLRPADTVVDVGCGTGLNFLQLEQVIGPTGRISGVDLTDVMLEEAKLRGEKHGWNNVSLIRSDAFSFQLRAGVNAILSTFALSLVEDGAQVIAHGSTALSPGGRFVVLDLKLPESSPGWLVPLLLPIVRPFAVTEVVAHRPWEAVCAATQAHLTECSWTELCFGFAFLAAGTHEQGDN